SASGGRSRRRSGRPSWVARRRRSTCPRPTTSCWRGRPSRCPSAGTCCSSALDAGSNRPASTRTSPRGYLKVQIANRTLRGRLAVDSCAGEFEARTPYYYVTHEGEDEGPAPSGRSVIVLGAGPNRIGQAIEFDYCCVHATQALHKLGYEAVLVNSNPETVSTDY